MAKPTDPAAGATTNYQWMKPAVASSPDVWGNDLNWDLDQIDSTMWSVSSAQSGYLPLTGGTLTGPLNGTAASFSGTLNATGSITGSTGIISTNGQFYARTAVAGNSVLWLQSNTAANMADFYWLSSNNQVGISHLASVPPSGFYFDGGGTFNVSGAAIFTGNVQSNGYFCRAGQGGALGTYLFSITTGLVRPINSGLARSTPGTITVTSKLSRQERHRTTPLGVGSRQGALNRQSASVSRITRRLSSLSGDADAQPLIVGSDEEQWGFIAHELQEHAEVPSAASGVKGPGGLHSVAQPVDGGDCNADQGAAGSHDADRSAGGEIMSTLTTKYGWVKPTVGGDPSTWGAEINGDLDAIDAVMNATRPGFGATGSGHIYNIDRTGSAANLWIDETNEGTLITSMGGTITGSLTVGGTITCVNVVVQGNSNLAYQCYAQCRDTARSFLFSKRLPAN